MEKELNLLVCEDEALVALELERNLEGFGHYVTGLASSGEDAVALAEATHPDLALVDITLRGEMNGIEVASILGERYNIPTIFITACSDYSTVEKVKSAHPLGFLIKPVDQNELHAAIELGMHRFRNRSTPSTSPVGIGKRETDDTNIEVTVDFLEDALVQEGLLNSRRICSGVLRTLEPSIKVIGDSLDILRKHSALTEQLRNTADQGYSHYSEVKSVLISLSNFALSQGGKFKKTDINSWLSSRVKRWRKLFRNDLTLLSSLDAEKLSASINSTLLELALRQLLANAVQASPQHGLIQVSTGIQFEELPERHNPGANPGWFVVIKVKDQGPGIDPEHQPYLYNPCYSAWPDGQRRGLGLSEVYGIMQCHGGWVTINPNRNGGSTAALFLPKAEKATSKVITSKTATAEEPKRKTVLIIDDDSAIVELLGSYFRLFDFKAYGFTNGTDALNWYRHYSDRVDLVFIDMEMPIIDGPACFRSIKEVNGEQPIAIMSGYTQSDSVDTLRAKGALEFFQKPFDLDKLINWSNQVIKARAEKSATVPIIGNCAIR